MHLSHDMYRIKSMGWSTHWHFCICHNLYANCQPYLSQGDCYFSKSCQSCIMPAISECWQMLMWGKFTQFLHNVTHYKLCLESAHEKMKHTARPTDSSFVWFVTLRISWKIRAILQTHHIYWVPLPLAKIRVPDTSTPTITQCARILQATHHSHIIISINALHSTISHKSW